MPSTFTTNTGIEKIGDGQQSGLWGQTTNLNFDIVDRALNGSVDVSLSGTTHTLTTSSGLLSDGQFAVLTFTGSPSGTNTVTIAPNTAQKMYFVRNTTAQTVVLSQGSGANVSIPAGTSKVVFSNGAGASAAVFDITNTLSGNLTGNVTGNVTGNLTGNAGTATALQTARTIGGVSFDGTANINLPGVNIGGNQNTTGSAASLTTARTFTIGGTGKTFNGTANVAWSLGEIGVNNSTLTLATSGIATGSQTWTSNQGTNATFTVNVPATNLTYSTATTTGTVNSSTGGNATIPAATTSLAGLMTNADKTKLDGIAAGAQVNVPTNLGQGGSGDSRTITSSTGSNVTISTATTSNAGFMSTGDKSKLDGIAAGAQVNVATNLGQSRDGTSYTITSSTGSNTTLAEATTSLAGVFSASDKSKLNGIAAGAQVNVGTNLSVTNGTTAGPTINSSTGSNVTFPTASGTISGAVTTGNQTWAGTKTFSSAVVLSTAGTATTHAVRADRTLTAGDGISGGGNLTANRSFAVDSTVVRTSRTITAGTGLTGGGDLSADRTINAVTLSQAQVEDPASTVFGTVSGQRLAQATAGRAVGALGTYALLRIVPLLTLSAGATSAGSNLRFATAGGLASGAPSGTWMLSGITDAVNNTQGTSVWLRIS
jgi:hypothetical protein